MVELFITDNLEPSYFSAINPLPCLRSQQLLCLALDYITGSRLPRFTDIHSNFSKALQKMPPYTPLWTTLSSLNLPLYSSSLFLQYNVVFNVSSLYLWYFYVFSSVYDTGGHLQHKDDYQSKVF